MNFKKIKKDYLGLFFLMITSIHFAMGQSQTEKNTGKFALFSVTEDKDLNLGKEFNDKNSLILKMNGKKVREILNQNYKVLLLDIPLPNNNSITLDLREVSIKSDNYVVRTPSGRVGVKDKGKHFRGRIQGAPNSMVAVSIFRNDFYAIFSNGNGDFNLGKIENSDENYIIYNSRILPQPDGDGCSTPDTRVTNNNKTNIPTDIHKMNSCRKVKLYWEADNELYLNKGTVANTENYLTAVFNQVATLYLNEGINLELSEIFVWDTADPYDGTSSSTALNDFRDRWNLLGDNFNGDLAHLVALDPGGNGGRAYYSTLCGNRTNSYGYSDIASSYSNVPTYSWTVYVIAHEIGHNLDSPHTHACSWNGNNTAIDDCGSEYFVTNNEDDDGDGSTDELDEASSYPSCFDNVNNIIPSGGGTIMSYCHLISGVGIDFNTGFHSQVQSLMLDNIDNSACLDLAAGCSACTDGVQNGAETGIDCGGPDCPACPTCSDGIQNGDETDVDCGGTNCPSCIVPYPYCETFEDGGNNPWTQSITDDFDWTINSGSTVSASTGPSSAYSGEYYIYTESSSPVLAGNVAEIYSPIVDIPAQETPQINFRYHMWDDNNLNDGSLELLISENGGTFSSLWQLVGNQGNAWQEAAIDISTYAGSQVQLMFRVTVTNEDFSFENDWALDDVCIMQYCPPPTIDISGDTQNCGNDDIILTATSGFSSYEWSTGAMTENIVVNFAGTYTVTVTDANGCSATDSHIIIAGNSPLCDQIACIGSLCSGTITFPSGEGNPNASTSFPAINYDCLTVNPDPVWVALEIDKSGYLSIDISNSLNADIDWIVWGPFASASDITSDCTSSTMAFSSPIVCDYTTDGAGTMEVGNVLEGELYVVLITSWSTNGVTDVMLSAGTNHTACDLCSDGIQNGDETGVDCGGSTCAPCNTCPAPSANIYVDHSATGNNDGSSWTNAYTDLQDALSVGAGKTIHVAKGTYKPTSGTLRGATFDLPENAELLGGYPNGGGLRNAASNATVLSGEIDGVNGPEGNSYHVVRVKDKNCVLIDGFTIKHGGALDESTFGRARGGGLYVTNSTLDISNTKIRWNEAIYGGGLFASISSTINILDSDFQNNTADYGSAIYHSNQTHLLLRRIKVLNNNSLVRCAIEVNNSLSTRMENCLVANNQSKNANGIALIATNRDQTFEMFNCTVLGESLDKYLFTFQIGYNDQLDVFFNNSIIAHQNLAFAKNVKAFNNGAYNFIHKSCYFQGTSVIGTNINTMLSSVAGDLLLNADYSVNECSPVVDAGDNSLVEGSYDIEKNLRITNIVDLGAFESQTNCGTTRESAWSHTSTALSENTKARKENEVNIYPNPTKNSLNIDWNRVQESEVMISIIGLDGKLIQTYSENPDNGRHIKSIDLSNLLQGIYFIEIITQGEHTVKKFEKL